MVAKVLVQLVSVAGLVLTGWSTANAGSCYTYPVTYYAPSYYAPTYVYYPASWFNGKWWPSGNYAKINGVWYLQNVGYTYGYDTANGYSAAAPVTTSYASSDWRTQLLDIAKQRDTAELGLRKLSVENAAYIEAVKTLGLQGNFNVQGYGQSLVYPGAGYLVNGAAGYANPHFGAHGSAGNTLYGYTFQSLRDAYGETSMNSLYQQSARLTQGAQQLAGDANSQFSGLVSQAGDNQARVAEILAKGQAGSAVLRAASADPSTRTQTSVTQFSTSPQQQQQFTVEQPLTPLPAGNRQDVSAFMQNVAIPKCASCHNGQNAKSGLDITRYPQFTPEQKAVVFERIFTHDPKRRMPLGRDGGPGTPLTAEERRAFVSN